MRWLDEWLNRTSMALVATYYLAAIVAAAVILGALGKLPVQPGQLLLQTAGVIMAGYVARVIWDWWTKSASHPQSWLITALIIDLLVPVSGNHSFLFAGAAVAVAIASKYVVSVDKQHIFNPAAVSLAAWSILSPEHVATWWIGTPILLPVVAAGGWILVRKLRVWPMVLTFIGISWLMLLVIAAVQGQGLAGGIASVEASLLRSPLIFLAAVMLTEPLTSPRRQRLQVIYAAVVAVAYELTQLGWNGWQLTPEEALLVGNVFSWVVSPHDRLVVPLLQKAEVARGIWLFRFQKPPRFRFEAGQYMEWILPHGNRDQRGDRRYFSLASSPDMSSLDVIIKIPQGASSFKRELVDLKKGQEVVARQLGGDFVLPAKPKQLLWIAGGVGIAPFIGMGEELVRQRRHLDVVLLYLVHGQDEVVAQDLWQAAEALGVRTVIVTSDNKLKDDVRNYGPLIRQEVPDVKNRVVYMSGPELLIEQLWHDLSGLGIPASQVKTDYFPGY